MAFKDGSVYNGNWKHNLEHGKGISIDADGNTSKGKWKHGYNIDWSIIVI